MKIQIILVSLCILLIISCSSDNNSKKENSAQLSEFNTMLGDYLQTLDTHLFDWYNSYIFVSSSSECYTCGLTLKDRISSLIDSDKILLIVLEKNDRVHELFSANFEAATLQDKYLKFFDYQVSVQTPYYFQTDAGCNVIKHGLVSEL